MGGEPLQSVDGQLGEEAMGRNTHAVGSGTGRGNEKRPDGKAFVQTLSDDSHRPRFVPHLVEIRFDGLLQVGQRSADLVVKVEKVGPHQSPHHDPRKQEQA